MVNMVHFLRRNIPLHVMSKRTSVFPALKISATKSSSSYYPPAFSRHTRACVPFILLMHHLQEFSMQTRYYFPSIACVRLQGCMRVCVCSPARVMTSTDVPQMPNYCTIIAVGDISFSPSSVIVCFFPSVIKSLCSFSPAQPMRMQVAKQGAVLP